MKFAMNRILVALTLVISFSLFVNPDLTVTPKTTEVLMGDSTFLNCSTSILSAEIHWFHYATGPNTDRSFVYGYDQFYPPFQGRFHMEKDVATGAYNLVIPSVKMEDAGKYECQDDIGRGAKDSADLVFLEASPACQSNIKPEGIVGPNSCDLEPEDLQLSCLVLYHGNQPPIITWKKVGTESSINEGTLQNVSDKQAIYYLKMEVNSDMDGSSYQCQTTRSATAQYACASEIVNVIGSESSSVAIYIVFTVILIITTAFSLTLGWCLHQRRVKRKGTDDGESPHRTDRRAAGIEQITSAAEKTEECSKQELSPLVKDNESTEELQTEIERLTEKVNELEQHLYRTDKTNYENSPILVHSIIPITAKKDKFVITGITILDLKLFAVYEKSETIEVYDSLTFVAQGPLAVKELVDPKDIASSKANHCLYIVNRISKDSNCEIITFDPNDQSIKKWPTEGKSVRLSTYESNLIACISDKRIVIEYSSKGDLLKTVRLSPGAGFEELWHAIKLTGTNFAISHKKVDEDRHRVCIVDFNGNVLQAFEELPLPRFWPKLNVPICLADDRDKSILVADSRKSRLLLLSSTLKFETVLMKFEGCPVRICLDETNGRIFVAENDITSNLTWKHGRISVFNVAQTRRR